MHPCRLHAWIQSKRAQTVMDDPIQIIQQEGHQHGYIWDAEGAVNLRRKHRLLGGFLGGVANYKSQNVVSGLPLQVSNDVVDLAVAQGWAQVRAPALLDQQDILAPPACDPCDPEGRGDPAAAAHNAYGRKRRRPEGDVANPGNLPAWLRAYYEYHQAQGGYNTSDQGDVTHLAPQAPVQGPGQPAASSADAGRRPGGQAGGWSGPRTAPTAPAWLQSSAWLRLYYQYYERQGAYDQGAREAEARQGQGGTGMNGVSLDTLDGGAVDLGEAEAMDEEEELHGVAAAVAVDGVEGVAGAGPEAMQVMIVDGVGPGGPAGPGGCGAAASQGDTEPWKAALQDGALYVLPIRADGGEAGGGVMARAGPAGPAAAQGAGAAVQGPGVGGRPAATSSLEVARRAVFADLHAKGYAMSAGPKFGADLLAYPGDPCLFHAQFTVRFLPPDQPINPLALKAAARGSHAARKHLLLAAVVPQGTEGTQEAGPLYISIAPETGFGKAS